MPDTEFGCLATAIGSMPHTDPVEACSVVSRYLKDIPAWPQLPNRSFLENMYAQLSEGFPGAIVNEDSLYIDHSPELDKSLEQFYTAYLDDDIDQYPISRDHASGLHHFLTMKNLTPVAVKGQITGPVTWGLTVTDDSRQPIIYDDTLGDVVAKFLRLKAAWQEKELRKIAKKTILFVDEPYMAAFGSVSMVLSKEKVISLLEQVFGGINGLKGVHCCGNTDWSVLLETSVDILSFDAYNYAQSLSLYPKEVNNFLKRKGAIAWGIVPNDEPSLAKETVASLKDRLEAAIAPFTRNGVPFRQLTLQGLLTPSCGLAPLSPEGATQALELLAGLSATIRKRYI